MNKGIHLTLMTGPSVPVPVPKTVLDALTSVQVTTTTEGPSGFQLTFTLSNRSPLQMQFLISEGRSIPIIRVLIIVTVNGVPEVLMDGVMTNHEITPGNNSGHSTMTITGEDLTRVMDYVDTSGTPYPAMSLEARVDFILKKYATLGIVPKIIPIVLQDVPFPSDEIPLHQGTDLAYIRYLADWVGYTFYIDPGPEPGTSIAYWGPQVKSGAPQKALNINMDAHTNVESLSFNFDNQSKTQPILFVQENNESISIPVLDFTSLNPPLGLIQPVANKSERITEVAKFSSLQATLIGMAEAARSADVVTGNGTLDVLRYGSILKARQLVGVRGAGQAFDGLYYVNQVTHNIKRGEYKQNFSLTRNGLVSTVPRVVP